MFFLFHSDSYHNVGLILSLSVLAIMLDYNVFFSHHCHAMTQDINRGTTPDLISFEQCVPPIHHSICVGPRFIHQRFGSGKLVQMGFMKTWVGLGRYQREIPSTQIQSFTLSQHTITSNRLQIQNTHFSWQDITELPTSDAFLYI